MSDKVTFSELVKSFAEAHEITQQKAETLIRGLFDIVIDDLEKDGKASITNFGSFSTKEVAERTGINPQTKEEIVIPAHTKVSFKPYKALENTVNALFADLEPRLLGEETSEKEEPKAVVAPIPQEEKFEDPFEEVISESNDEINEESNEENEETVTPPPVYKAPEKESEGSSAAMWILAIVILFMIGSGLWYFFLRDADDVYNNKEVAVNQPNQTEQTLPPPPPPRESVEPAEENAQPAETKAAPKNATSTSGTTAEITSSKKITSYIIKKDEWMWDISRKVYGEPFLWPLIFEANKTINNDPNLVEPAKTLMVPSLEGDASNLTKADFARLATASKMVSDAYANAGNEDRSAEYLRFSKKYERHSKN